MQVPTEALTEAKCGACNKYLSYFPIYIAQDKQSICGRCSPLLNDDTSYIRDTPYESLAKFLKFPCIYNVEGCLENLFPQDVPSHENDCPFRIIFCPLDCMWQGTVNDLLQHFEELHSNSILKDGEFEMDFLASHESYSLMVFNDEIFSLKRKFDQKENTFECAVFCYKAIDPVTKYKYQISVQNGSRNLSVAFPPKSAISFERENITQINVDDIRNKLKDPIVIIGKVIIFNETEDMKLVEKKAKKPNPEINYDMLAELECPVCFDYITPPIYQCVTGHSICSECKVQVSECPSCKEEIKNTQNFTLEKMAYFLTYPCRFTEYGCDFASKPGKIKQHQKHCLFGPHHCPLRDYEDCPWKDAAKNIYSHVLNVHHDNILEIDTVNIFIDGSYLNTEDRTCYIMKFSDSLFKLHYLYKEHIFYWAMQLIGPSEEAKKYKFEIDIIDNTDNKQRMFLRKDCAQFAEKEQSFQNAKDYAFINQDQINSFFTDMFTFRVRVIK